MKFLECVAAMGKAIEANWENTSYAEAYFNQIACDAVDQYRPQEAFVLDDLMSAFLRAPNVMRRSDSPLPPQDLALVLVRNPRFTIDVTFWNQNTDLHSHHSHVVFALLKGSVLNVYYDFTPKQRSHGDELMTGDLRVRDVFYHRHPGDKKPHLPGEQYIHEVWHLAPQTITLRVRYSKPLAHIFLKPGLAFKHPYPEITEADLQRIIHLQQRYLIKHPQWESDTITALQTGPLHYRLYLLLHLQQIGMSLEQCGTFLRTSQDLLPFEDAIAASLHNLYATRVNWANIRDQQTRLALSLLKTCPRIADIHGYLGAFIGGSGPQALSHALRALNENNLLPFRANATALELLCQIAAGEPVEQATENIAAQHAYTSTEPQASRLTALQACADQLRSYPLLRPLFTEANICQPG